MRKIIMALICLSLVTMSVLCGCTKDKKNTSSQTQTAALAETSSTISEPSNKQSSTVSKTSSKNVSSSVAPSITTVPKVPVVTSTPKPSVSSQVSSTAAKKTVVSFDHATVTLPEGFYKSDNDVYLCPDYPTHTDCVSYGFGEADDINSYTKESVEELYSDTFGMPVTVSSFDNTVINGVNSIVIRFNISLSGVSCNVTQYIIFGSTFTDTIAFYDVSGIYTTQLAACMASISVK